MIKKKKEFMMRVEEFEIRNPPIPPKGEWKFEREDFIKITEDSENLKRIRGEILNSSVQIEKKLDFIINEILIKNREMKGFFKEFVLDAEFFGFFRKWRVFREFSNRNIIPKEFCDEELRKDIKFIIDTRNKFAHGTIFFQHTQPCIEYFEGGKKIDKLTSEYFDKISETYFRVFNKLTELESYYIKSKIPRMKYEKVNGNSDR